MGLNANWTRFFLIFGQIFGRFDYFPKWSILKELYRTLKNHQILTEIWQKRRKNLVQLAFNPFRVILPLFVMHNIAYGAWSLTNSNVVCYKQKFEKKILYLEQRHYNANIKLIQISNKYIKISYLVPTYVVSKYFTKTLQNIDMFMEKINIFLNLTWKPVWMSKLTIFYTKIKLHANGISRKKFQIHMYIFYINARENNRFSSMFFYIV